jgi:hypothetical protein
MLKKFFSVIDNHENKLEPLSFTSLTYIKVLLLVKIDHYSKPAMEKHPSLFAGACLIKKKYVKNNFLSN